MGSQRVRHNWAINYNCWKLLSNRRGSRVGEPWCPLSLITSIVTPDQKDFVGNVYPGDTSMPLFLSVHTAGFTIGCPKAAPSLWLSLGTMTVPQLLPTTLTILSPHSLQETEQVLTCSYVCHRSSQSFACFLGFSCQDRCLMHLSKFKRKNYVSPPGLR